MVVLAVAAIAIAPKPMSPIASSASGKRCSAAAAIWATPSSSAPRAIIAGVERPEKAIDRAAIRDPIPEAAMRNP